MREQSKERPSLRPIFFTLAILLLAGLFFISEADKHARNALEESDSYTTLIMENHSDRDSVLTWLTLGADTQFITNVQGIFGIADSGLQGSFRLKKDTTYTYTYQGKGLSGNFSFIYKPENCPAPDYPTGINLFEVTINNDGTVYKAQETVDVSNVAGINALWKVFFYDGNFWICNGHVLDSIVVDSMYQNSDNPGVYPFRCDKCVESLDPPVCSDTLPPAHPQDSHRCNVSRSADLSGGYVKIVLTDILK